MSKGDLADLQQTYDAVTSWLRDCCRKGDSVGVRHAESKLKALDIELAKIDGEHV